MTEIAEDAERTVIELCGKIQKFYPSRWEKAAKNGGKLSTMAGNFRNFLQEIDGVLQDNPDTRLQPKWQARVHKYKQIYREEIEQHL